METLGIYTGKLRSAPTASSAVTEVGTEESDFCKFSLCLD